MADRNIAELNGAKGLKLVSTAGTTPLKIRKDFNQLHSLGATILEAPDHAKAMNMVERKEADALLDG